MTRVRSWARGTEPGFRFTRMEAAAMRRTKTTQLSLYESLMRVAAALAAATEDAKAIRASLVGGAAPLSRKRRVSAHHSSRRSVS